MGDVVNVVNSVTGGFSLKDLATAYVDIAKAKINSGMAAQSNTIDQLKGTVSLLAQQNAAQQYQAQQSSFDMSGAVKWLVLAGGVFLIYKMVK